MSVKKTIKIGVANQGERSMSIDEIKDWVPKDILRTGDSTLFKVESTHYIMKTVDFKEIFGK